MRQSAQCTLWAPAHRGWKPQSYHRVLPESAPERGSLLLLRCGQSRCTSSIVPKRMARMLPLSLRCKAMLLRRKAVSNVRTRTRLPGPATSASPCASVALAAVETFVPCTCCCFLDACLVERRGTLPKSTCRTTGDLQGISSALQRASAATFLAHYLERYVRF